MGRAQGSRYEAVLFDFAGVIAQSTWNLSAITHEGVPVAHEDIVAGWMHGYKANAHPWCRWELGELDFEGVRAELTTIGVEGVDWRTLRLDVLPVVAYEPLVSAARTLRRDGYRTALVSNTMHEFTDATRAALPLEELFDEIFRSCEIALRKPGQAFFAHVLNAMKIDDPARAIFLDDTRACIDGALEAGLTVIHVKTPEGAVSELRKLVTLG